MWFIVETAHTKNESACVCACWRRACLYLSDYFPPPEVADEGLARPVMAGIVATICFLAAAILFSTLAACFVNKQRRRKLKRRRGQWCPHSQNALFLMQPHVLHILPHRLFLFSKEFWKTLRNFPLCVTFKIFPQFWSLRVWTGLNNRQLAQNWWCRKLSGCFSSGPFLANLTP